MSEVATQIQEQSQQIQSNQPQVDFSKLAESAWSDEGGAQQQQQVQTQQIEQTQTNTQVDTPADEVLDEDVFMQRMFGMDGAAAKKEWDELRQFKANQPQPVESRPWNELINEHEDKFYSYLDQKRRLDRLEKYENPDTNQAAEIIKANLQFKNGNLSSDEVNFLFDETYNKPSRPVKSFEEEDAEYEGRVKEWEQQVQRIERKMIIDAKLAQPEFSKYKSQISPPDIPQVTMSARNEPTPEELAEAQQRQVTYSQSLDNSLKSLNDFKTTYKDKEVEIPLSFEISNEQRANVKNIAESLYSKWDYLINRWSNSDGSFDTNKIINDIARLEYGDSAMQKFVNEAGAQRLVHEKKIKNNININQPNQAQLVNEKSYEQLQVETIWGA